VKRAPLAKNRVGATVLTVATLAHKPSKQIGTFVLSKLTQRGHVVGVEEIRLELRSEA
jgi:hypothetical protein